MAVLIVLGGGRVREVVVIRQVIKNRSFHRGTKKNRGVSAYRGWSDAGLGQANVENAGG